MTASEYTIEIALCILLGFGIFYSIHLGRALAVLRRDRRELADLVARLDESGRRAEDGVEKLQTAGEVSGRSLGRMIDQSRLLQGELEVLSTRADTIAERLETLIRENKFPEKEKTVVETIAPVPVPAPVVPSDQMVGADRAGLPSLPASPTPGVRPYEQRLRQRTAAEQDLIRALRMS
ncbi:DUF6468 domain-containing protein [Acetobacter sp.]|jgi:hypothetical protein|uniref:DUF6468 domain-containing protein n=1 Tax=Acetobacter sp. TaxID=440 RepID=UPI0025B8F933|nr:DUF6468 domain-containing protein [Acetobacter sp.]MCH4092189.1 DUF6468 domain-containing protein [Acetobacter sp.]MCI1299894.1 DUF6468 domain-containing protein [Acetobacter sp.]MCI1315912.1 DUF6468 domain-containing protein [Acetobacter sp.]